MAGAVVSPDFGIWNAPGHSITIKYSAEVMDQIRSAAVDGYHKVRHGGLETGGILFGGHEPDVVRVLAWRPIACEHAKGPSFTLSEADETALAAALQSWRNDPELAALEPVGWYHSHTRSEIFLSESDLEFFSRFFPQPWQIALVVRPASFVLVRAGFFFREADGRIHAESSYGEFPLTSARLAEPAPAQDPSMLEAEHNGSVAVPLPAVSAPPRIAPPPAIPAPRRRSRLVWYLAGLILLAAAALGLWRWNAPRPRLALTATDLRGALRIAWDRTAGPVRSAARGRLEIDDRGVRTEVKLTPADLRAGSISYARQSGDVAVRLRVEPASGSPVEEATRFLQPSPSPAAPAPEPGKQELEREAEALRQRLEQQKAELSKLQQMVDTTHKPAPLRTQFVSPAKQPEPVAATPVVTMPPQIAGAPAAVPQAALPAQKIAPPPAPVPSPPPPPRPRAAEQPASGRLIWTGKLAKGAYVVIEGNHASAGALSGRLPARAARISAWPGELTAQGMTLFTADPKYASPQTEAAGEQNGWNRTTYVLDTKRAAGIRIIEQPGPQNGYRVVLQSESGKASVVLLDWRAQ